MSKNYKITPKVYKEESYDEKGRAIHNSNIVLDMVEQHLEEILQSKEITDTPLSLLAWVRTQKYANCDALLTD